MDHDARLTWHRGSILPYASLWHTVHRVIALNDLVPTELSLCTTASSTHTPTATRTLHLLRNENPQVDTAILAHWLGEPADAFRWSHLGKMPQWSACLFMPGMRICTQCVKSGYHSALHSLRLLDVCPIHHTPLVHKCHCGRAFSERIKPADFVHAGSCVCGRMSYFTKETCRRPTLPAELTQAFEPVVSWLEQVATLIRPKVSLFRDQRRWDDAWLSLLPQWCEALDIVYPDIFERPPPVARRVLLQFQGGKGIQRTIAYPVANSPPLNSAASHVRWKRPERVEDDHAARPSIWVYRAMARHLRRHMAPDAYRWISRIQRSANPLHIAQLLRDSRKASMAFAMMLWSHEVETIHHSHVSSFNQGTQSGDRPLTRANQNWLRYQVAGIALLAIWRDAMARTCATIRSGIARWESAADIPQLLDWVAMHSDGNTLAFLALVVEPTTPLGRTRPDKSERQLQARREKEQRDNLVQAACVGSCLTWAPQAGWSVAAAFSPAYPIDCRRRRLLVPSAPRPWFWVFAHGDGFVVRLCNINVQTKAATPKTAIESMHRCVRLYVATFGAQALGEMPESPPRGITPQPANASIALEHNLAVDKAMREVGFWRCAGSVNLITEHFLSIQRTITEDR